MDNMTVCNITDLGSISRGKSKHRPRNDSILYGGQYPFIQTADVKRAILHLNEYSQTYNEVGLSQSKLWKKGTLCFTIAANIAESAILDIEACFPDSVVGFIPFEGVSDTVYVKYLMDELKLYFQQISKGTTQDNLSLEKICRVKLQVPDYPTQKKIASILSAYDELIENNNKRIKTLEQMAESLYKEWFVHFRFPGYENAEFEDGIPKGWTRVKLKEIVKFRRGKSYSSNDIADGELVLLSMNNIRPYGGFIRDYSRVFGGTYKDYQLAHKGDLLMSITDMTQDRRIIGYVGIFDSDRTDCVICTHLMKLETAYSNYFMYGLFTYGGASRIISEYATGVNVLGLTESILNERKVLLPYQELISKYHNKVETIWEEVFNLKDTNDYLTKQRDLLLPRLMSGKLEV